MKINWRRAVLYTILLGQESCWLYTLLFLVKFQLTQGKLSILYLWLVLPLAFVFNLLMRKLKLRKWLSFLTNLLLPALAIMALIKFHLYPPVPLFAPSWLLMLLYSFRYMFSGVGRELIIFFSVAVLWWLGGRLSRRQVNFDTLLTEFQLGMIVLLLLSFAASVWKVPLATPVVLIVVFFALSLLGMALAHTESSAGAPLEKRGLLVSIAMFGIALIVGIGLLLSVITDRNLLELILLPIKWAFSMFWKGLAFLIDLLPPPKPEALEAFKQMPIPAEPSEELDRLPLPELVGIIARTVFNVVASFSLGIVILRISSSIIRSLFHRTKGMPDDEVESLKSDFWSDLLRLLQRILYFLTLEFIFKKRQKPVEEDSSIRYIYRQLLKWGAGKGLSRSLFETPYEYRDSLASALPGVLGELQLITEYYVSSRYGKQTLPEEELSLASQGWHSIKKYRANKKEKSS